MPSTFDADQHLREVVHCQVSEEERAASVQASRLVLQVKDNIWSNCMLKVRVTRVLTDFTVLKTVVWTKIYFYICNINDWGHIIARNSKNFWIGNMCRLTGLSISYLKDDNWLVVVGIFV